MSDSELAAAMALTRDTGSGKVFRTTMIVEAYDKESFEWAMKAANDLANAHVIRMSLSRKNDPSIRVEVRTSHPRRKSAAKNGKQSR